MHCCRVPNALCSLSVEFCLMEVFKAFLHNVEDHRFSWFSLLSFHLSSPKIFCFFCISFCHCPILIVAVPWKFCLLVLAASVTMSKSRFPLYYQCPMQPCSVCIRSHFPVPPNSHSTFLTVLWLYCSFCLPFMHSFLHCLSCCLCAWNSL